jgi:hypothetical protein
MLKERQIGRKAEVVQIHLEVLRSMTIGRDLSQSPTLLQSCTRIKIEYPGFRQASTLGVCRIYRKAVRELSPGFSLGPLFYRELV